MYEKFKFFLAIFILSIVGIYRCLAVANDNDTNNLASTSKATSLRYSEKLGRSLTFLGLGALEIGRDWGIGLKGERQHPNAQVAKNTLETALQHGVGVIDTAASYHFSEEWIGKYAKPAKNKFLLITKTGESSLLANDKRCKKPSSDGKYCSDPAAIYDFSRAAIRHDVETSLQKLHVNRLDVVLIHFGPNAEEVINKGEAVAALKELQREGKVHHIGASIDDDLARRCIDSNDFDVIEMEYNLLHQNNSENIALAHAKGMTVIIRGGLGTGLLTAKVAPYLHDPNLPYAEQLNALVKLVNGDFDKLTGLALAFLYKNKNINSVIVGANTSQMLLKDMHLLNSFHDEDLLEQAEKIMAQYKPESYLTSKVDPYFFEKMQNSSNN